jgi:type IV/VI secretion system ImpK/VasF family protein
MLEKLSTTIDLTQEKHFIDPFTYLSQHFPLPDCRQNNYHRSSIYTPHLGNATLVNAAGPLLSIMHRMSYSNNQKNDHKAALQHEFQAFIDHITQAHFTKPTVAAASFCLMALLHQTEHKANPDNKSLGSGLPVFSSPLTRAQEQQIFISLTDACCDEPEKYIGLLELIHVCLHAGYNFDDEQSKSERNFDQIKHQVYRSIQSQRPKVELLSPIASTETNPKYRWSTVAVLLLLCGGSGLFLQTIWHSSQPIHHLTWQVRHTG